MIDFYYYLMVFASISLAGNVNGFFPSKALSLNGVMGTDHKKITECAMNRIAIRFLMGNSNYRQFDECPDRRQVDEICKMVSTFDCRYYGDAQSAITEANCKTDFQEGGRPLAHFDAETFLEANSALIEMKRDAIGTITQPASDYVTARLIAGRIFHTLQDFYSHSNWVELGNKLPHPALVRSNLNFVNLAQKNEVTCYDCVRNDCLVVCIPFTTKCKEICLTPGKNGCLAGKLCAPVFTCNGNVVTAKLTSGYSTSSASSHPKPRGKCSHGGPFDASASLSPNGGINKDSRSRLISPHYYLHDRAGVMATEATYNIFADFWQELGDNLFGNFIGLKERRWLQKRGEIADDDIRLTLGTDKRGFLPRSEETEPVIGANMSIMVETYDVNVTTAILINQRGDKVVDNVVEFTLVDKRQWQALFQVPSVPFRIKVDSDNNFQYFFEKLYKPVNFEVVSYKDVVKVPIGLEKLVNFTINCYGGLVISDLSITARHSLNNAIIRNQTLITTQQSQIIAIYSVNLYVNDSLQFGGHKTSRLTITASSNATSTNCAMVRLIHQFY